MSLLKAFRIPLLRSASRPALAARMSSLPGGDGDFETESTTSQLLDDLPPVGPASAYPPPNPNPISHSKAGARNKAVYSLYVQTRTNNNIITFTRPDGSPIITVSGGQVGYKHKARGTAEAAHLCALKVFKRIEEESARNGAGNMSLEVLFNGFGKGRDAVNKILLAAESAPVRSLVSRVTDMTPVKIGGTRAKKARRT